MEQVTISLAERAMLTDDQADALGKLRWLWPGYTIKCDGPTWTAHRSTDPQTVLTAGLPGQLWQYIQIDDGLTGQGSHWTEANSGPPFLVKSGEDRKTGSAERAAR